MLDSANLPSQTDLNGLYGAWNPMSYMQGQQNQDLAAQFRQQAFDANTNDVTRGQLQNQQSAAMNPLLLQSQQLGNTGTDLTNQGKQIGNQSAGLDLASKQGTFQDTQDYLHSKLAREMSDEDLTTEGNKYLKLYQQAKLSGNQEDEQKYGGVLDTLVGTASAKASDRIQQRQLKELDVMSRSQLAAAGNESAERIAGVYAASRSDVAGIGASAKEYAANLNQKIDNQIIQLQQSKDPSAPARIAELQRYKQITTPGWAGGVDVGALGSGKGLQANVPTQAPPLSNDDLVNKYLNPPKK